MIAGSATPGFSAEKKKEVKAVVEVGAANDLLENSEDVLSQQLIQGDDGFLRRKAFIQELGDHAMKLRLELAQIVTEDEQKKLIDQYRQDAAKRIQDFLASEKAMTAKSVDSKTS